MSGPPLTRVAIAADREAAIRAAVRAVSGIPFGEFPSRLAQPEDAEALFEFLSDAGIHGPIYNLPKPLTLLSVRGFIEQKLAEREAGEGFLFLRFDEAGDVLGYSEFDIWPQWGAGELGGALRADRQGQRAGIEGARQSFTWMFETLHLELICETAALDNIRTARLLDHLGFERKGEITSTRPDGTTRPSLVWEVTRQQWADAHGLEL